MSDQNPNVELNKEEDKLIVENNSVENTENGPKVVKKGAICICPRRSITFKS